LLRITYDAAGFFIVIVNAGRREYRWSENTTDEGNQGPNSELYDQGREQLVELLEGDAQAHDWETDFWTSKQVAALIENKFGIDYTPCHCSRRICKLGYRPIKSREGPR